MTEPQQPFRYVPALTEAFERHFQARPEIAARAPGRVNLIGEHTDYNEGWVLPAAIEFEVNVVLRRRGDRRVRVVSADLGREASFDLDSPRDDAALWLRYPQGVALALLEAGHQLAGMDAVYSGDVPVGAGLSSSAAVEVAFAAAFNESSHLGLPPQELALLAHVAENRFVGVPSGIMDQFISSMGRRGHALLLDCRSLDHWDVGINLPDVQLAIVDTGVRRELASSEYRKRREECESAVDALQARRPDIRSLRDVSPADLTQLSDLLSETQYKRARHVVEENERTLAAARALEAGDAEQVGQLMYASHESLRDLYEVSSPELDAVVEAARSVPGVVGARMTGAGFGGAAVALIHPEAAGALTASLDETFGQRFEVRPTVYIARTTDGAEARRID